MMGERIEAVWFDWDRTLVRVVGDVTGSERLAALFQSQGLSYTADQVQQAINRYQTNVAQGNVRHVAMPPQTQRDIMKYYTYLLEAMGHEQVDQQLVNKLYSAYALLPTMLYEDTIPTLASLQQRNVKLGVISNHSITARPVMERMLGDYIPPYHIVISQEVGVHKPAKTIFQEALTRAPVVAARNVFVGDNLKVDAIGAVRQGGFGYGVWLDREEIGADDPLPKRVIRITTLHELADRLPL